MTNILYLTIPFLGRIFIQRDNVTLARWEVEDISGPAGREWLLCCGSLWVYLTPSAP